MHVRRWSLFAAIVAVLTLLTSAAPALAMPPLVHGLAPADLDLSVDPRQEFYRYANGGWLDRTTIPSDRSSYGVFTELNDETIAYLTDLLACLGKSDELTPGSDEWKAAQLYRQGL